MKKGFTLLELILVLILISIIMGISSAKLGKVLSTVKIRSTARGLRNFLYTAELVALKNQTPCIVKYDFEKKIFNLYLKKKQKVIPLKGKKSYYQIPDGIKVCEIKINDKTHFRRAKWEIRPLYAPQEVKIYLRNFQREIYVVTLFAGSGIVEIKSKGIKYE